MFIFFRAISISILLSLGFSTGEAVISYSNVEEGSVTINYNSDMPIYGFQFTVSGVDLTGVSSDFDITNYNAANGVVIALSTSSASLPAGSGSLAVLNFSSSLDESNLALNDILIGGEQGASISAPTSSNVTIPSCSNGDGDMACDVDDQWADCSDDGTDPYDDCGDCNGNNACLAGSGLSAIGGLNEVMLQWSPNANAASYNIYRDGDLTCSTPVDMPYYLDDGTCPGSTGWGLGFDTAYCYSVAGVSANVTKGHSQQLLVEQLYHSFRLS